jgi:hypothetical protein
LRNHVAGFKLTRLPNPTIDQRRDPELMLADFLATLKHQAQTSLAIVLEAQIIEAQAVDTVLPRRAFLARRAWVAFLAHRAWVAFLARAAIYAIRPWISSGARFAFLSVDTVAPNHSAYIFRAAIRKRGHQLAFAIDKQLRDAGAILAGVALLALQAITAVDALLAGVALLALQAVSAIDAILAGVALLALQRLQPFRNRAGKARVNSELVGRFTRRPRHAGGAIPSVDAILAGVALLTIGWLGDFRQSELQRIKALIEARLEVIDIRLDGFETIVEGRLYIGHAEVSLMRNRLLA